MRIVTIALMMVAFCIVAAQPASGQRGDRKKLRARLLQRFDKDGDGKLDKREKAAARKAMQKLRASRRGQARRQRGARGQQMRERGARAQRRGRGVGELRRGRRAATRGGQQLRQGLMRRFDRDRNGRLDVRERRMARQRIQQYRRARRLGPPRGLDRRPDRIQRGKRAQPRAGKQVKPKVGREAPPKRARKGQQANRRKQLMNWFDANRDGRLDSKERRALMKVVGPAPKKSKRTKRPEPPASALLR
jgi:Ca2+-binding EF-hand superfamily protein